MRTDHRQTRVAASRRFDSTFASDQLQARSNVSCCAPTEQASCCGPEDREGCCGPAGSGSGDC